MILEGGNVQQRFVRGLVEYAGGRGYPEASYDIMNNFAKDVIGIPYDEMEPFERRLLRDVLAEQLDPIMADLIHRGDKAAQYWEALKQLDQDRIRKETKLLEQFYNPKKYPQFYENGRRTLQSEFMRIQNEVAVAREYLNKQFGMYQDDNDFDEDDPGKFILQEWYALYDKAAYEGSETFDSRKLNRLQAGFWNGVLPNGESYSEYQPYVVRNTTSTEHPEQYRHLLSPSTTNRWARAESARAEYINNRGNWSSVLNKE